MIDVSRKLERDDEPAGARLSPSTSVMLEVAQAVDKTWREAVRTAVNDGMAPPDRPPAPTGRAPTATSGHHNGRLD